jgi:hypothetical protein
MASSRLSRINEKRTKRQGLIYLILSLGLVLILVRWGVPGFINLLSWWSDGGKLSQENGGLQAPPQTPALSPLPEATFSASIRLAGIAQPNVSVRLISNGQIKDEQDTDLDGNFAFRNVALLEGKNVIGVQAVSANGLESNIAQTEIIFDAEAPKLEIFEPADESEYFGAAQRNIQIRGTMNERGEIYINSNFVSVSVGGEFEYRYSMEPGMNEITITAIDRAGNQATKLLRLRFSE